MTDLQYVTKEIKRANKIKKEAEKYGFRFIRIVEHNYNDIEKTLVELKSLSCEHKFTCTLNKIRYKGRKGDKFCTRRECRKKNKTRNTSKKWSTQRVENVLSISETNLKVDPSIFEVRKKENKKYYIVTVVCEDCGEVNEVAISSLGQIENGKRKKVFCTHCFRERRNNELFEFFKAHHPTLEFIKTFFSKEEEKEKTIYRCTIHDKEYTVDTTTVFTKDEYRIHNLSGCPDCATSGIKPNSPYIVYYLRIWDEEMYQWLYKIGITWGTSKYDAYRRMKQISKNMQLVEIVGEFDDYYAAREEELRLHELYRKDSIAVEYMESKVTSGGTEFFWRDVLEADIQSEQKL